MPYIVYIQINLKWHGLVQHPVPAPYQTAILATEKLLQKAILPTARSTREPVYPAATLFLAANSDSTGALAVHNRHLDD